MLPSPLISRMTHLVHLVPSHVPHSHRHPLPRRCATLHTLTAAGQGPTPTGIMSSAAAPTSHVLSHVLGCAALVCKAPCHPLTRAPTDSTPITAAPALAAPGCWRGTSTRRSAWLHESTTRDEGSPLACLQGPIVDGCREAGPSYPECVSRHAHQPMWGPMRWGLMRVLGEGLGEPNE